MGNICSSESNDSTSSSFDLGSLSVSMSSSSSGDTPSPVPKKWTAHVDEVLTEKVTPNTMGSACSSSSEVTRSRILSSSSSRHTPTPLPKKWMAHLDEILSACSSSSEDTMSGSRSSSGNTPITVPKNQTAGFNFVFKKKKPIINKTKPDKSSNTSEIAAEIVCSPPSIEQSEASYENNNAADDGTKVKKSKVCAFFRRSWTTVKKTCTRRSNKIFPA